MGQSLLRTKHQDTTFYTVCYRGNDANPQIADGIHHTRCATKDEAARAVEACKRFFNEEKIVETKEGKEEIKIVMHDRVHVWIDTYKNGEFVHSGEPGWSAESEKSSAKEKEPATSSTAKK